MPLDPSSSAAPVGWQLDAPRRRGEEAVARAAMGRSSRPRGFTLMELLLVLVILVTVGALVVPLARRTFAGQTLRRAADRVRGEFSKARNRAIESGAIYTFVYVPGSNTFAIAPFSEANLRLAMATSQAPPESQFEFTRDELPRGVFFAGAEAEWDARAVTAVVESGAAVGALRPILFYPDGTSQQAALILQNEQGAQIEVRLRGLTGMATAVPLYSDPSR